MRTRLILKPGQKGTKKLHQEYGGQLVCVRYRYDDAQRKRYKTVELIVEELPWQQSDKVTPAAAIVGVRVGLSEAAMQNRIKLAGGKWDRAERLWELRYDRARELGLEPRIVQQKHLLVDTRKASTNR